MQPLTERQDILSASPAYIRVAAIVSIVLCLINLAVSVHIYYGLPHPDQVRHLPRWGGDVRIESFAQYLFIYPGFQFRLTGALLTNFHLPQSTLLMLVCAFAGQERVLDVYRHAVAERYRFYSYGDCMFVE